jgi:uncharacterized protein YbjT (DUF2867 family)
MVNVLVFGATGSVGKEVARAFARNGHTVYGLTRSAKKAHELQCEESKLQHHLPNPPLPDLF